MEVILKEHPLKLIKQDLLLHGRCEELSLELLTEEDVATYLDARFVGEATGSSPFRRLAQTIHRRTEGNPLFLVNIVDYLLVQHVIVQRGGQWRAVGEGEDVTVPSNIRQFIEQQVEQLSPESRQILEAASVVGMEFSIAVVTAGLEADEHDIEQCCAELARRGQFLHARAVSDWPDGTTATQYEFLHALYQEVLYDRLPADWWIALHRRIGERVESAYGTRSGEVAVELARHFEQGREYPRAVQYLWQAGDNAVRRGAHREAVAHLTRALALLEKLPARPSVSNRNWCCNSS